MKVSAFPFEAPRDIASSATDAGERARADQTKSENNANQPAAVNDVKSELDTATRESLTRLASLIRSQLKATEEATEATEEQARRDLEETEAKEARTERALKIVQGSGEDETILRERVTGSSFPAVARIEKRFREERRKRGVQVYTNQKTRESIDLILAAVSDVKPPGTLSDAASEDDAA